MGTEAVAPGQLFRVILALLCLGVLSLPMVLPSDRELDRLVRAGTGAPGRAEARPPLRQPPVCGRRAVPAGPEKLLSGRVGGQVSAGAEASSRFS